MGSKIYSIMFVLGVLMGGSLKASDLDGEESNPTVQRRSTPVELQDVFAQPAENVRAGVFIKDTLYDLGFMVTAALTTYSAHLLFTQEDHKFEPALAGCTLVSGMAAFMLVKCKMWTYERANP